MDPLLLGTAAAFGLAASAGLNTSLPLLIVGLLARIGQVELSAPFTALASDVTLAGLALFALLEIVGDKVPGLDSIVQAVQLPLAAAAGAILFASQNSVIRQISPELTILVGLLTAGGIHAARAAVRPAVTLLTAGLGNTAVSTAEDLFSLGLAATSLLLPGLGLVLLVGLLAGLVMLGSRVWRPRGHVLARARPNGSGARRTG